MFTILLALSVVNRASAAISAEDIEYLNELSLDKLLRLKSSLQDLVTARYENYTVTEPTYLQRFGAHAMPFKGPPVKRTDYEEGIIKKGGYSKISSIFSMSVSTLAFLAFGGYLLCLIVQAVKSKPGYEMVPGTQPTFFVSAGIKKRPQPQFTASYGRRKRDAAPREQTDRSLIEVSPPPDQLFSALVQLCEGYVKWSDMK